MSRLIVYLKPTTMDKVLSLIDKLKKYDIVEDVAHVTNEAAQQSFAADVAKCPPGKHNFVNGLHCSVCGEAQF